MFADGIMPRRLIYTSKYFQRAAVGLDSGSQVRIHVAGIDLVRDVAGEFRVLEDNVRIPSGSSYVVENRRTMARIFPGALSQPPHPAGRELPRSSCFGPCSQPRHRMPRSIRPSLC